MRKLPVTIRHPLNKIAIARQGGPVEPGIVHPYGTDIQHGFGSPISPKPFETNMSSGSVFGAPAPKPLVTNFQTSTEAKPSIRQAIVNLFASPERGSLE